MLNSNPPTTAAPIQAVSPFEAWISVVRAYHLCGQVLEQRLRAVGVKAVEHEVLVNLLREPGLSQQVLADRCFAAKSYVSGLLTGLEARGLVRRDPDPTDARAKRLFLTDAGAALAGQCAAIQQGVVRLMAEPCTDAELNEVALTMQKVGAALAGALAEPG